MAIPEFEGTVPRVTQDQPEFDTNTQAILDYIADDLVPGINEVVKAFNFNATTGTSSTSVAIGTGSKSFTATTGKSWVGGMFIVIADAAAPSTNSMTAQVTSYNSGTGSLVVDVKSTLGSGTKSSWVISQTMNPVPLNGSVTNASVDKSIITGQSDETSPAPDDELLLSDKSESSGALNKITLTNLLKVVNGLTEDTSPDKSSDFLLSYDASSSAPKKVTPENAVKAALSAGGSAPAFACRAWVNFNGTGTVAIRASGNVTSITDNNTGEYTINFAIALPDANYVLVGNAQNAGAILVVSPYINGASAINEPPSTTAARIQTRLITSSPPAVDATYVMVAVFR
jgi:hypothetical protein